MTKLQDLLLDERLIGGGVIFNRGGDSLIAMAIGEVEVIAENWILVKGPWQVTRDQASDPWVFSDINRVCSFTQEFETLRTQDDDSKFRVLLVEDPTGFSIHYASKRTGVDMSKVWYRFKYVGHFNVFPDEIIGFPDNLQDLSTSGWPRLDLTDEQWLSLIGFSNQNFRDLDNAQDVDAMNAIPCGCGDAGHVESLLSTVRSQNGYMSPAQFEELRESIEALERTHDLSTEAETWGEIVSQLSTDMSHS